MSQTARDQIRQTVDRAVENLRTLAEKTPAAAVGGEDFNKLLERARATFPDVPGISDIGSVQGGTTMAELLFKLSLLQGAVHSWFTAETIRSVEAHNRRIARDNRW